MVHHHIKENTDTSLVRAINQCLQIGFVAHIGIKIRPVLGVVTVVGIMWEIAFCTAANPAMNLLKGGADPQGIDAQLLEIIQSVGQAT